MKGIRNILRFTPIFAQKHFEIHSEFVILLMKSLKVTYR
jgi:hypothetical protein